jgi:hypothetical protein
MDHEIVVVFSYDPPRQGQTGGQFVIPLGAARWLGTALLLCAGGQKPIREQQRDFGRKSCRQF